MEENIKIEYENRRQEIKSFNERILKFLPFAFTVVSSLTLLGVKYELHIAHLISNVFLLWAVSFVVHSRQYIYINASYCAHFLENKTTELFWEKRLQEFRKHNKIIAVRCFETIFFIFLTLSNSLMIFAEFDEGKPFTFHFYISLDSKFIIGALSFLLSILITYILIDGLLKTKRNNWPKKHAEIWEEVDKKLTSKKQLNNKNSSN